MWGDIAIAFLLAFITSFVLTPYTIKIARKIGAVDVPNDERRMHKKPMPKLGGVGIFLAFLFGYILFGEQSIRMNSILIGSFIVILMGIVDDLNPVRAKYRFLVHIVAAMVIVFYGGILLDNITAFGFSLNFGILSYPITILFIVACTDVIDLIDGLDGLSGGICSIFYLTIGIICFFQGRMGSLVMVLTLIMLGSTLGFLVHNFHPAKIFAGDCVTFMGFIIAVITLLEFKGPALISFFVPVTILGIPILDTLFAIIRRLLKGQPPFQADKEHLHHQLLGMNFSQTTTVLIIYLIDIIFAAASIFYTLVDPIIGEIIYILIFIIVLWFVLHTTIISEKTPKKTKEILSRFRRKK